MKIPILTSIGILALTAAAGWRTDHRLNEARRINAGWLAEAAALGIPVGENESGGAMRRPHDSEQDKSPTESLERKEAGELSREFRTLMLEVDDIRQQGRNQDDGMKRKITVMIDRLVSMNAEQLKAMIGSTLTDNSLKENLRQDLVASFLMQLGKLNPQEALALWRQSPEKFTNDSQTQAFVTSALSNWSRKDPSAAMEWITANNEVFSNIISDNAKRDIVVSVAASDPALAFEFARRLKIDNGPRVASGIAGAAATPKARTTALAALRTFAGGNGETAAQDQILAQAMPNLAKGAAKDGFSPCTAWIRTVKMDEKELFAFVRGIPLSREEGLWIEWMGRNLPADKFETTVHERIAKWAAGDHKAVGDWLNATPDSPVRQAAISAFAETVARYEPESAEQWAMTLPAGARRDGTLKQIRSNWPATAPEAAAAFARRHGLE